METFQQQFDRAIKDYATKNQYGVSLIPSHLHNGSDTSRINEVDLIPSDVYSSFYTEDVSEDFKLINVPKSITKLTFVGFAANNAGGNPTTLRAIVNGTVYFGKIYSYTGSTTTINVSSTLSKPYSIIHSGNSMYIDSTTLANNKVSASQGIFNSATNENGFVMVVDSSNNVVASMGVKSFINDTILIQAYVATNWKIQGLLTLT